MKTICYNVIVIVGRSLRRQIAAMAQLVERILGKDEVPGSNPGSSSKTNPNLYGWGFWFVLGLLPHFERIFFALR